MKTHPLVCVLVCLTGCPQSVTPETSNAGDSGVEATLDPDASSAADASSVPAADPAPSEPEFLRFCIRTCQSAADCVSPSGSPLDDEDNWACEDQRCVPLGCQSVEECQSAFGPNSTCAQTAEGVRRCRDLCMTAADCTHSNVALYADEENWSCVDDLCVHMGCSTDQQCNEALPLEPFGVHSVCIAGECRRACSRAADCAPELSPLVGRSPTATTDEDNFQCVDGGCEWLGCNSDAECSLEKDVPVVCESL